MANKKLGRGLNALIPDAGEEPANSNIKEIKLDMIDLNPYQPRKAFNEEEMNELADSIKEKGIIQPITVCLKEDHYQLIAGERRYRASNKLHLSTIPAYIIKVDSDEDLMEIALVENIQREDLNAIEEAKAYQQLNEEFGLTHIQISEVVGKERTTVSNLIRLLKLDESVQIMIQEGKITSGHARAILQVPESNQQDFANLIFKKQMSVRMAEEYARKIIEKKNVDKPAKPRGGETSIHLKGLENKLHDSYSCRVSITQKNDKGRISFFFNSHEEMNKILDSLKTK